MPHSRRRALGRSVVEPWLPCIGLVLAALALASLHAQDLRAQDLRAQDLRAQDLRAQDLRAQDYPNRTVRIVVPFPAGGTADAMPRIIGDWLARKWGQAVVIENKPGAAGNIGAEAVYRADPDGYTLLATPQPPLVINQSLYPKLGFDPQEFEPIIIMGRVPSASLPIPGSRPARSPTSSPKPAPIPTTSQQRRRD
jgi:hypothetical protein